MNVILFIQLYFYFVLGKIISFSFKPRFINTHTILYLEAFYPENSGYHWRAFKWAEELKNEGYPVDIFHALNKDEFNDYSNSPSRFMVRFLRKRFWQVVKARNYETVIVRRELLLFNDYGNLFLEKLLRKLCNNLILDFDDDLAASKKQPKEINSLYAKLMLENGNSFRESFKYYDKFIVASDYLKEYVLKYRNINEDEICVIPTCVDYDKYPAKVYDFEDDHVFTLGWIGGDHNYPLLQNIIPILNELAQSHHFQLLVIGGKPFRTDAQFKIINKQWSLDTEVENLYKIDVGLMPLDTSERSKGKGGFKLIQYMGLGIVSVAQDVTINSDICENEVDSFLYNTDKELCKKLKRILKKEINLNEMGRYAKEKITNHFSISQNKQKYIKLILDEKF